MATTVRGIVAMFVFLMKLAMALEGGSYSCAYSTLYRQFDLWNPPPRNSARSHCCAACLLRRLPSFFH